MDIGLQENDKRRKRDVQKKKVSGVLSHKRKNTG